MEILASLVMWLGRRFCKRGQPASKTKGSVPDFKFSVAYLIRILHDVDLLHLSELLRRGGEQSSRTCHEGCKSTLWTTSQLVNDRMLITSIRNLPLWQMMTMSRPQGHLL